MLKKVLCSSMSLGHPLGELLAKISEEGPCRKLLPFSTVDKEARGLTSNAVLQSAQK
jgi:hypothetical protein